MYATFVAPSFLQPIIRFVPAQQSWESCKASISRARIHVLVQTFLAGLPVGSVRTTEYFRVTHRRHNATTTVRPRLIPPLLPPLPSPPSPFTFPFCPPAPPLPIPRWRDCWWSCRSRRTTRSGTARRVLWLWRGLCLNRYSCCPSIVPVVRYLLPGSCRCYRLARTSLSVLAHAFCHFVLLLQ